jgi:hypothetical protein
MARNLDEAFSLAPETAVPSHDAFADDAYGEPDDAAFESVAGLYDHDAEGEVRQILGRVLGS